jgi:UDP-glucose 4-epimerase
MARVLVTGGAGFIGSHLVEALLGAGHKVRVLDDLSTGRRQNLEPVWGRIEFRWGTVTSPEDAQAAAEGMELVYHLAALPSVQRSLEDPLLSHAVCATGTLHVLEAARRAGAGRLIYAASSSAYGDMPGALRRETDVCRPLSPYAAAKLAGEHFCQAYTVSFGLETVRLRLFNVFGPRQDPASAYSGVVARFIGALCRGQQPVVHGDGHQSRDFTYVDNAVQALLLAAEAPGVSGNVYNVGAGGRTCLRMLLGHLAQLLNRDVMPAYGPPRAGDVRHSHADLTRARQDLGYEPRVPLLEGLRRTAEAYQAERSVDTPASAG